MAHRKQVYRLLSVCFVIILLLPAFGILREKRNVDLIAEMENRTISPKPHSAFATKDFFNEFQNWFEDRVLGRKDLIRFWAGLNGKLFHVLISNEVSMGKDGFLYSPSNLKDEMADREQKLEQFSRIKQICDRHHARFIFCMVPHGEWMLGELVSEKHRPADIKKLETELESDLKQRGIDYCMFGQKMLQLPLEERQRMYCKGDPHWNSKGAFFGAKELLRRLALNNRIETTELYETQETGNFYFYTQKIGWKPIESVYAVPWSHLFVKDFATETHEAGKINKGAGNYQKGEIIVNNPKTAHKVKVLVLSDSFFGSMLNYLMQDIGTVIYTHNKDILEPKKNIDLEWLLETYKPEIVVYEKAGAILYKDSFYGNFGKWKTYGDLIFRTGFF